MAAVGTEDSCDGIPERGLAIPTFAISNNECFDIDMTDGAKSGDPLNIGFQLRISTEEHIKGVLPDIRSFDSRSNGSTLRDEVLRPVRQFTVCAFSEIDRVIRRVQKKAVLVQFMVVYLDHRPGFFQCRRQILGIPVLNDKCPVGYRSGIG